MEMEKSVYPAPPGAGQVCGGHAHPFSIRRRHHVEKLKTARLQYTDHAGCW
jgi:hypothetical protein